MAVTDDRGWAAASARLPAWSLAVGAILSVQLGIALSVHLFEVVGPIGTAFLRLAFGGLILIAIARPRRLDFPAGTRTPVALLGLSTAVMMMAFSTAVDRIPLGTAIAIEFLGPLGVAAARARDRSILVWPALALVGVVFLTRPWEGALDPIGVVGAVVGALCWACYILLTQHVGDRVAGVKSVAVTIPIAALVTLPFGLPQAVGGVSWSVLLIIAGLSLLTPVLPWILELVALRRLTATAFGTLMALEPGIAAVAGALILHQLPDPLQMTGIALVTAAGVGAARSGDRQLVAPVDL